MANNTTIKERLAILETRVKSMNEKLDNISNNHLPHIEKRIEKLEINYAKITGYAAGVGAVVGIIIQLVSKYVI
mgnify:CR=1 FL=1